MLNLYLLYHVRLHVLCLIYMYLISWLTNFQTVVDCNCCKLWPNIYLILTNYTEEGNRGTLAFSHTVVFSIQFNSLPMTTTDRLRALNASAEANVKLQSRIRIVL